MLGDYCKLPTPHNYNFFCSLRIKLLAQKSQPVFALYLLFLTKISVMFLRMGVFPGMKNLKMTSSLDEAKTEVPLPQVIALPLLNSTAPSFLHFDP